MRTIGSQVTSLTLVVLVATFFNASSSAENWPQFRGTDHNFTSDEGGMPSQWDANTNIAWKIKAQGEGWASPVIWGNKVIIAAAVPQPASAQLTTPGVLGQFMAQQRQRRRGGGGDGPRSSDIVHQWQLQCYERDSGNLLWTATPFAGKPSIGKHRENTYASETPVTDGKHIWAYFGMTGVCCYTMEGQEVWKKDLGTYPMMRDWGTSSSPVVYDGLMYVLVDSEGQSFLTALDALSGEERWRVERDEASSWSSLVVWKNSHRTELIAKARYVRSYDPKSGRELWSLGMGGGGSTATPSVHGDRLYVGGKPPRRRGGDSDNSGPSTPGIAGMYAIKAGASGDITLSEGESGNAGVAWIRPGAGPDTSSALVYEGCVYLLSGRSGEVTCLDASTGELVYQEKIPGAADFWASPWAYDGKVFCLDGKGQTHVLAAGKTFEVLGRNTIEGRFWASAAMAGKTLILRSADSIYAVRVN